MSVGGDKPVTISLQTEARGAHLKQRDDWPAAIAGQHHETGGDRGGGGRHQKPGILSEALCRPACDRTPVIVWFPDQNHFVSQSAEKNRRLTELKCDTQVTPQTGGGTSWSFQMGGSVGGLPQLSGPFLYSNFGINQIEVHEVTAVSS